MSELERLKERLDRAEKLLSKCQYNPDEGRQQAPVPPPPVPPPAPNAFDVADESVDDIPF